MPDACIGAAVNENYRDFISGFRTSPNELRDFYHTDCITQVNFQYAIVYVDEQQAAASPVSNFSGNAIPRWRRPGRPRCSGRGWILRDRESWQQS